MEGSGCCLVSCPSSPLLPAPRVLRCVWRAVLSRCPLPTFACTPFHAVCAFRGLGPVALLVFPACPLCVCALAPTRRPRFPPPLLRLVWRAHLARSLCWALVGPFHSVLAPPRFLLWSRAPFDLLCCFVFLFFSPLGGAPGPVSPLPGLRLCARRGVGLRVRGVSALGAGVGGGGQPVCHSAGLCGRGASGAGGCLASVRPSAFPDKATKRVFWTLSWPRRAWAPYRSGSCLLAVFGRGPCGALVRRRGSLVHRGSCGRRRLGRGDGPCSGLPPGYRDPTGRRGDHCHCLRGGVGASGPVACGSVGVLGGSGGIASWLPSSLSGGGDLRPSAHPPSRHRRIPSRCTRSAGVLGQPAASQPAWRGGEGGLWAVPAGGRPGGRGAENRVASVRPSALPGRATLRASPVTPGPPGRGPHTAPVRCGRPPLGVARALVLPLVRVRGPAATPAGASSGNCGGARRAGTAGFSSGGLRSILREGGRPLGCGGGRGSAPPWPAGRGGLGGERGGGRRCSLLLRPAWRPVALVPVPHPLRRTPPGYTRVAGRSWAPGAVRSATGGSVRGGGGLPALACSPAFCRRPSSWAASPAYPRAPLCCCGPRRRRSAAGRQRAMRE